MHIVRGKPFFSEHQNDSYVMINESSILNRQWFGERGTMQGMFPSPDNTYRHSLLHNNDEVKIVREWRYLSFGIILTW